MPDEIVAYNWRCPLCQETSDATAAEVDRGQCVACQYWFDVAVSTEIVLRLRQHLEAALGKLLANNQEHAEAELMKSAAGVIDDLLDNLPGAREQRPEWQAAMRALCLNQWEAFIMQVCSKARRQLDEAGNDGTTEGN